MANAPELGPIEERRLDELRPHPEQAVIFGDPTADTSYPELVSSLRKLGQLVPLTIKADGTILCGHARVAALTELKRTTAQVRVASVDSYRAEVELMIRDNTDRRQLTERQKAWAFNKLRNLPKEEGGTKPKMGRPAKEEEKSSKSGRLSEDAGARADDSAAATIGISKGTGRNLEEVFVKEDVPEPVKEAVDAGKVAVSAAAEAIKAERKRQGGTITDPAPLTAWTEEKVAKKEAPKVAAVAPLVCDETAHEERIRKEAEGFRKDIARLTEMYRDLSQMTARRPLASVLGHTEHHEYLGLLRDIGLCALTQVESVNGPNNGSRQIRLVSNNGEKP